MDSILFFKSPVQSNIEEKISGVMEIANQANWHVQVLDQPPTPKIIRTLIDFWHPVGIIVECGGGYGEIDVPPFKDIPTVFFDRNPDTLPKSVFCVSHDSRATAKLVAKEALSTGFEHFAFVHSPGRPFWSDQREEGFREALVLNGKDLSVLDSPHKCGTIALLRDLKRFLTSLPRPCAVFAANDRTAADVIAAANLMGLAIPDDLAVIGVDNRESLCERTVPQLTSVAPDFHGGGVLAATMLLSLISGTGSADLVRRRTFGPLRIVRRASTRILKFHDRPVAQALDLISRAACTGLTAARVLKVFTCSRGEAERRFRRCVGKSILEAIQDERLARAKEMLRTPGIQLKAVSDYCGFKSPGGLRKFFREQTGQSMSDWRKSEEQR